jgi:hypothetical protein
MRAPNGKQQIADVLAARQRAFITLSPLLVRSSEIFYDSAAAVARFSFALLALFRLMQLLREVVLVSHLFYRMQLAFQPINMVFFVE